MWAGGAAMRPETQAALAAIDRARVLLTDGAGAGQVTSKGGRDLVTATDVAVEDAMRADLSRRYTAYAVIGEERGGEPDAAGRPYWLLDPICGTRAFASGIPLYCVNLALVEHGQVTISAVSEGADGPVSIAEHGSGAWRRAPHGLTRLRADDRNPILCIVPPGANAGEWAPRTARFVSAALLADRWYVWMLASTVPCAYLAAGRIAAVAIFGVSSPVHTAAGYLLASEAGALVTDLAGQPWDLQSPGLVAAATPALHQELLQLVADARPPIAP